MTSDRGLLNNVSSQVRDMIRASFVSRLHGYGNVISTPIDAGRRKLLLEHTLNASVFVCRSDTTAPLRG